MSAPLLSLVMIRTAQPEVTLAFYRAIGCEFAEEKHGDGPVHHSCEMGGIVFEIYPGENGAAVNRRQAGATMLSFTVPSLNPILSRLTEAGAEILAPAKQTAWGLRAIVADPDGRAVNIAESTEPASHVSSEKSAG